MTTIMHIETNPTLTTINGQAVVLTVAVVEDLTATNIADAMTMKMTTAGSIGPTILNMMTNIVIITQPKSEDVTKKKTTKVMMIVPMGIVAM
mgnify:CR=1 FL=1